MRLLRGIGKALGTVLLLFAIAVLLTGMSPIYSFRKPAPFSGPDIFNPYSALDTALGWKRANFHTHTRVTGPLPWNECQVWPEPTWAVYEKLGYDILTFSNHNEITRHPWDSTLQVNVYEQGYSPFKFHKLVFGSRKVKHWDPLLPLLASQKQWELERLARGSDFIQINHPYRTIGLSKKHLEKISGYEIMELDTSVSTENEYWDWALSAGHYSFGLANDDIHKPNVSFRTGIRCNFLQAPSGRYGDLRNTLLSGCYYAMRVPDYGDGNWEEKIRRNREGLPQVKDIGLKGQTVYLKLSHKADSIRVNGQNHATLALAFQTDSLSYTFRATDPYVRFTAFFPDGEVIYSNPFARYDASGQVTPLDDAPEKVNWLLTLLWNLGLLALVSICLSLLLKLFKR